MGWAMRVMCVCVFGDAVPRTSDDACGVLIRRACGDVRPMRGFSFVPQKKIIIISRLTCPVFLFLRQCSVNVSRVQGGLSDG